MTMEDSENPLYSIILKYWLFVTCSITGICFSLKDISVHVKVLGCNTVYLYPYVHLILLLFPLFLFKQKWGTRCCNGCQSLLNRLHCNSMITSFLCQLARHLAVYLWWGPRWGYSMVNVKHFFCFGHGHAGHIILSFCLFWGWTRFFYKSSQWIILLHLTMFKIVFCDSHVWLRPSAFIRAQAWY